MKRNILYIFLILVAALSLVTSCSDDIDVPGTSIDDGILTFTITIPGPDKVETRAEKNDTPDERDIKNLSLFIYDNNGQLAQAVQDIEFTKLETDDDATTTVTVALNDHARELSSNNEDVTLYLVANAKSLFTDDNIKTVSGLKSIVTDSSLPRNDGFLMSGKYHGKLSSVNLLTQNIILYRTEAKVSIVNRADKFTFQNMALFRGAKSGYVAAGSALTESQKLYSAAVSDLTPVATANDNLLYVYPVKNNQESDKSVSVVIGGKYGDGATTYYRIDLRQTDPSSNESTPLDIEPNHWYEISLDKVSGQGYATAEEAAKHPAANVSVTIYDHAPDVLDMAFDGTHELGVTDVIEYKGNADGTKTLTVKYYSKYDSDMDTAPTLSTNAGFISISKPEISDTGDGSSTAGKIATYTVTFINDGETGALSDIIKVDWCGLSRQTKVIWDRPFDGASICSATLTIHPTDGTGDKTISDYWDFLNTQVFGVKPEKMGGLVRNQGFHFPVMYGNKGKTNEERWKYTYDLTLKNIAADAYDCQVQITGDKAIQSVKATLSQNANKYHLNLTREGNICHNDGSTAGAENDYLYGTGKLILTFTAKNATVESRSVLRYSFDLYHTGFFHNDPGNHHYGNFSTGYYYYEVLPVAGAYNRTRYMLDRNIGAKAAGMYIENSEGIDIMQSVSESDLKWPFSCRSESAGAYYQVGSRIQYQGVNMYTNVTPPGYRVPQQKLWDAVRSSVRFLTIPSTLGGVSYFTADYSTSVSDYLATGVPDAESSSRTIYFPKCRYVNTSNSKYGEANTGYYWTASMAYGLEKAEIGRWLRTFQITGQITSYMNGNVEDNAMSVRAINDITENNQTTRISFYVKGATNVFLYIGDKKHKLFTTSWPGHAIGNYETATQTFNFVYDSSDYTASDFKVIFTYIDKNNKIWVVNNVTCNGKTYTNSGTGLNDTEGIPVNELVDKNVVCTKPSGAQ